ncbi:MAG: phosphatidylserine/phosphatidylglycerophosphate/cardiolipin synthase family protein [Chloroflexi bacterium]|nr:phosphatidylserine/phosphatidylglycerophosphate/cardiolipin synthase family protein [Chloroflexota bacterium]
MDHSRQIMAARGQSNVPGELLQSMLVTELLQPSPAIWIVSPWITNINVIDNSGRRFGFLDPGPVSLARYISLLLDQNSKVYAVLNNDHHNDRFIASLEDLGVVSNNHLTISRIDRLHAKGIVSHHFSLTGSMNITYSGVNINDEFLEYTTESSKVHETIAQFETYLGPSA